MFPSSSDILLVSIKFSLTLVNKKKQTIIFEWNAVYVLHKELSNFFCLFLLSAVEIKLLCFLNDNKISIYGKMSQLWTEKIFQIVKNSLNVFHPKLEIISATAHDRIESCVSHDLWTLKLSSSITILKLYLILYDLDVRKIIWINKNRLSSFSSTTKVKIKCMYAQIKCRFLKPSNVMKKYSTVFRLKALQVCRIKVSMFRFN